MRELRVVEELDDCSSTSGTREENDITWREEGGRGMEGEGGRGRGREREGEREGGECVGEGRSV